jgi:hypothetical protein
MSSGPVLQRLNIHTFEHALAYGKTPLEVMIQHASIINWTKISKIIYIVDICRIGKQLPWVHVTYAPESKKAVEIIKNLELMNRI